MRVRVLVTVLLLVRNLGDVTQLVRVPISEMINKCMKYTIYQITNNINGKIYLGKHQTKNPYDGYYGSGKAIKEAIKKYGKENFSKEVLFVFDTETEMNAKEKELITEDFVNRKDTYNLGVGGEGGPHFLGKNHSKESIEKMLSNRGKIVVSDETRKKLSIVGKRKTMSPEARAKISAYAKTRKMSEETKKKISETLKNKNK